MALFVLACGQGAALRSAQEAGEKVQESSSLLSGSNQSQSSTEAVKEISLAELSAMNKASTKGTASGKETTSGKVAKPLPQGATASGTLGTATRSSGAAANSSGMSVPAPRTTVPGSGSSTGVSRTSARGVGPDLGVTKDITGLERVVLKGGNGKVLTQSMMSQRCRRYIIEGPFDLAGKAVTMPYGSVLDLENGELRNGTLVMDQTRVTPIYGISKETRISKVKVTGEYYETLVDLWGVHEDPVFPWDTSAPKKVYVVDLKKFGITPGYQKKGADGHYTDRQYDLMYQNGVGFTEAIQWAYKNGYDGIRFPKNDYCFTPRTTKNEKPQEGPCILIQDIEKFDIDLGSGRYYGILDSSKKSKYYVLTPDKPYAQGYSMFFLAACINVQVHGGKIVGDRTLRDYEVGAEKLLENSIGIVVSAYCQNIRLHHLELSGFMADGINCLQSGGMFRGYDGIYQGIWRSYPGVSKPIGDLNYTTLSNYLSLNKLYTQSDAMSLSVVRKIAAKRAFSINNNLGYTRLVNPFHNMEVLTYNEEISIDNPLRVIRTSYLETIYLEPGETGIRVRSSYDEGAKAEGIQHSETISELITSNLVIENCYIHDNHRGGISGGCNHVMIRNCRFYKDHTSKNYTGKTIPLFLIGGTNYHINFEDSFAKELTITDSRFSRSTATIGKLLFGVYTLCFKNNYSDAPVILYNNIATVISNNTFTGASLWLSSWRHSDYDAGLQSHGFKYLTRTAIVQDNRQGAKNSLTNHTRTIVYDINNIVEE